MTLSELDPATIKGIETIQKLLNLAARGGTPEEAANAQEKADALLLKYNLTADVVNNTVGAEGRREEKKVEGGYYKHQRWLWNAVARLNFCVYWTQEYRAITMLRRAGGLPPLERKVKKHRHALVGRTINTRSTIAMAGYLEQAVERLVRERLGDVDSHQYHGAWSMDYREGAVMTIIEKLEARRATVLDAETQKERDIARAAESGASSATTLTIAKVSKLEEEANLDFIHGEGYSARRAAQRAENARRQKEEEESYTKWAAANPKEAAQRDAEAAKRRGRYSGGKGSRGGSDGRDWGAYRAGREGARGVGLDYQAEAAVRKAIL